MVMQETVCYLCRGARKIYNAVCAACVGKGRIITETHRCGNCGAPTAAAPFCKPCLDHYLKAQHDE